MEKYSLTNAAKFLDESSLAWTREKKCGSCHTNYPYLYARPLLSKAPGAAQEEIRAFFEDRAAHWDSGEKGAKPRWDAEVLSTAVALALHDKRTTGRLHPLTRQALDKVWSLQKADGSWNWLKCDWPPFEHDDYFGAVLVAIGVAEAPEDYAKSASAKEGLAKLKRYLRATAAPDMHHKAWLLWAASGLEDLLPKGTKESLTKEIAALQRSDGGWSLPSLGDWKRRDGQPNDKDAPSDGYATGLAVFVLRQSGMPPEDAVVRRGAAWLTAHQRASGRWFTRSVNNDKAHYVSHAGTAFAVLALHSCGMLEPTRIEP